MKYHLSEKQLNNIIQILDSELTVEDVIELHIQFGSSRVEIWDDAMQNTRVFKIDLEAEGALDEQD